MPRSPKLWAEDAQTDERTRADRGGLKIGPIELPNGVLLAPMSGITDPPFRGLVARLGAGLVISEMTASQALTEGRREALRRAGAPGEGIHVIQLAGCEPRWMAEGARLAEASGARIIDINMGCPCRRVTNGYSGSALMRDLDHALTLIAAVIAAVQVPVTLKMRLGWDDRSHNAAELARRAEAAGVRLVTVHGRTRCQFYAGKADWTAVRRVKQAVRIPVVVNGDITGFDEATEALAQSGADAIMVGRGAQGRPWFPGQLARFLQTGERESPPSLVTQHALLEALYAETLEHHGIAIGVRHARKHLAWGLDAAALQAGAPAFAKPAGALGCAAGTGFASAGEGRSGERLQHLRARVLTSEQPAETLQRLAEAYDAMASDVKACDGKAWRTAA